MRRIFIFLLFLPLAVSAQFNTDRLLMVGRSAIYYEDYVLSIQYFNQAGVSVVSIRRNLPKPSGIMIRLCAMILKIRDYGTIVSFV